MTKYLKHINTAITTYSSGRTDFVSITATPNEVRLYDDVINEDNMSVNYNAHIWDDYIKNNYWTIINIDWLPVWNMPVTIVDSNYNAPNFLEVIGSVSNSPTGAVIVYNWILTSSYWSWHPECITLPTNVAHIQRDGYGDFTLTLQVTINGVTKELTHTHTYIILE